MNKPLITVGWREWVSLPELKLPWIKAKVDSGKEISILHTFLVEPFERDGVAMVRFGVHPHQHLSDLGVLCEAPIEREHEGHNAAGEKETHYIIKTTLAIGDQQWPTEILLLNLDEMQFRLLLGHSAIDRHVLVDPAESYLSGAPSEEEFDNAYKHAELC